MRRQNQRAGGFPIKRLKFSFCEILSELQDLASLVEVDHIEPREARTSWNSSERIQPQATCFYLGKVFHNSSEGLFNSVDELYFHAYRTSTSLVAGAQLLSTHSALSREAADRS